jgi:hypothetical protein
MAALSLSAKESASSASTCCADSLSSASCRMNIQYFSMISAAYFNPTAYGNLSGANCWVWLLSHVLADEKFMTIFSMLFGAGILLMTSRV